MAVMWSPAATVPLRMLTRTRFGRFSAGRPAMSVTSRTRRAPASRASTLSTKPLILPMRGRSSIGAAMSAVRQMPAAKPANAAAKAMQSAAATGRPRNATASPAMIAKPPSGAQSTGSRSAAKYNRMPQPIATGSQRNGRRRSASVRKAAPSWPRSQSSQPAAGRPASAAEGRRAGRMPATALSALRRPGAAGCLAILPRPPPGGEPRAAPPSKPAGCALSA